MKKIELAVLIALTIINQVCAAEKIQPDAGAPFGSVVQISADSSGAAASAAPDFERYVTIEDGFYISGGGEYKVKLPENASLIDAGSAWFSTRAPNARTCGCDCFTWLALTRGEVERLLGRASIARRDEDGAALPAFTLDDAAAEKSSFTTAEFDDAVSQLRLLERSGLSMSRLRYDLFRAETYRKIAAELSGVAVSGQAKSEAEQEKEYSGTALPPQLTEALSAIRSSDEFSVSVQQFGKQHFVLLGTNVTTPVNAAAAGKKFCEPDKLQKQIANVKEYVLTLALTSQADNLFLFCMYAPSYPDESAKLQEQYSVFKLKKMKKEYDAELVQAKQQRDAEIRRMLSSLKIR